MADPTADGSTSAPPRKRGGWWRPWARRLLLALSYAGAFGGLAVFEPEGAWVGVICAVCSVLAASGFLYLGGARSLRRFAAVWGRSNWLRLQFGLPRGVIPDIDEELAPMWLVLPFLVSAIALCLFLGRQFGAGPAALGLLACVWVVGWAAWRGHQRGGGG